MATGRATGGIKIPSSGETTPEYNAVQKSYEEIEPAIIPDDFVRRARSCGLLIPTRNSSSPPLDVVLNEISRHPVDYYSLQHVVATLNVGGRFDKGIGKMEKAFQLEMRKYIPASSSEDPKVEPENCPKVFISFSRRKVYSDSPDAYTEAEDLYDELKAQGCKPWMDKNELEFGDNLAKEIFWAIKQCDFIIPIMTGGYATSLWCLRELYYAALQKDPKRPKTIIPVLLEDEAVINHQNAGKWLLRIGTVQKYFRVEEKDAVIKSLKDKIMKTQEKLPHPSSDNLLNGTFQAECNPVPVNQIDANTNAQALSADQSPQDNFSSAIGTSDQCITSLHSSKQEPHTDTSLQHIQSISHYSSVQASTSELNPDDRRNREAQLRSSADNMKIKFASLLMDVIISFKRQGIDPDDITSCILAITEYDDPAIGKPLLEKQKEKLEGEQNINRIFNIVRPHMTFFNHEILKFVIEKIGSPDDKHNLQAFLDEFNDFCRRSVFELPSNTLGHSEENAADRQKFHVKITNEFRVAFLLQSQEYDQQASSSPTSSDLEERERICAPELDISLEDAKHIQKKLATVLKLTPSSIYLDSANLGCVILTFLLPSHISLAGLDSNPDAIALSDIGIRILCGPPGKPEPKELTSKGLIVQWSRPEYGCSTLKQCVLYYQSKDSESMPLNDWQKIELSSQQTHTCVPDLRDGDTYVFRVSSVSDAGTLQYSDESDPISITNPETLAFSSADPSSAGLASIETNVEDVFLLSEDVKMMKTQEKLAHPSSGGNIGQEMPQSPNIDPSSGSTSTQRRGTGGPNVIDDDGWMLLVILQPCCGRPLQFLVMILVLVTAGLWSAKLQADPIYPIEDIGAKTFDGEWYDLTDSIFDERPDMMKLRHLELPNESSLDIAERIADSYMKVGGELLQDLYGIKMENIRADNKKIVDINHKILMKWLQGNGKRPVSWRTLIQVLEKHGKIYLAHDIRTALLTPK